MGPRSRGQLAEALAKRQVPAEAATAVLDRFTDVGLIDDAAFAAGWVESRQAGARSRPARAGPRAAREGHRGAPGRAEALEGVSLDDERSERSGPGGAQAARHSRAPGRRAASAARRDAGPQGLLLGARLRRSARGPGSRRVTTLPTRTWSAQPSEDGLVRAIGRQSRATAWSASPESTPHRASWSGERGQIGVRPRVTAPRGTGRASSRRRGQPGLGVRPQGRQVERRVARGGVVPVEHADDRAGITGSRWTFSPPRSPCAILGRLRRLRAASTARPTTARARSASWGASSSGTTSRLSRSPRAVHRAAQGSGSPGHPTPEALRSPSSRATRSATSAIAGRRGTGPRSPQGTARRRRRGVITDPGRPRAAPRTTNSTSGAGSPPRAAADDAGRTQLESVEGLRRPREAPGDPGIPVEHDVVALAWTAASADAPRPRAPPRRRRASPRRRPRGRPRRRSGPGRAGRCASGVRTWVA